MKVTFEGSIHEILDQIEAFTKAIVDQWSKPIPQPKKAAKPKIEQPEPTPCQGHAVEQEKVERYAVQPAPEDLLGAVMSLVNGDKEKKAKLVSILATFEAKTIGALGVGQRDLFWAEAKRELGDEQ